MGAPMVMENRNSAALQNCAFVSTRDIDKYDPGALFAWTMDALMLGVGVGFDTLGAEKEMEIYATTDEVSVYTIPDTREGWVESTRLLINSFLTPNKPRQEFNYELDSSLRISHQGIWRHRLWPTATHHNARDNPQGSG